MGIAGSGQVLVLLPVKHVCWQLGKTALMGTFLLTLSIPDGLELEQPGGGRTRSLALGLLGIYSVEAETLDP
jgi:hypothetical protein